MERIAINLIVTVVLLVGVVLLQILLSKRESKWPGLVLPIIAFSFGLLYPLNMVVPSDGVNIGFIFQMVLIWLLGNIPTCILLAIYFGCRDNYRRNKQLEKMNIQDLD